MHHVSRVNSTCSILFQPHYQIHLIVCDVCFLQERRAISLAVKKWQEDDKMEDGGGDGGVAEEEDIYAVQDDSDTEDVAMVTDDQQEKSLMAHVSGNPQ